ncbi:MAG: hypothetical protein ACKO4T_00720 [Planctomycetaceae bacterium]
MTLVVGTDEAGYGPNLGPLVVAATVWEADPLADDVEAAFAAAAGDLIGLWGDSKAIFRGAGGLAALERGAVAGVVISTGMSERMPDDLADAMPDATPDAMPDAMPDNWQALLEVVAATIGAEAEWSATAARLTLPRQAGRDEIAAAVVAARGPLAARGLRLRAIRCRIVQPREFNALLAAGLNKSDILSQITLGLAATAVTGSAGESVVWCDRHGGRRRYAPLVAEAFATPLVQAVVETPERSVYRLAAPACRIEFSVRGESRLPVALASMTAKYVRELAMAAFNDWWCGREHALGPTAGYPVDAARWRREATAAVEAAGVSWDDVWRRA